jgi:hypothetical protein
MRLVSRSGDRTVADLAEEGPAVKHPDEDVRLAERAARCRWPIPDEIRPAVIARLVGVAVDPKSSDRVVINACNALANLDRVTLAGVEAEIKAREHDAIEARLRALEEGRGGPGHRPPELARPGGLETWGANGDGHGEG